jgi:hypothetical protein
LSPRRRLFAPQRHATTVAAFLAALLAALLLAASARATAPPTASIESVWAFNGGQVAVVRRPNGSYAGLIDASTTFARCSHPVGEQMWSEIRLQPDGSYWGLHQWFFESEGCQTNPTLGPSAWRVMTAANGSHFLRVCFSQPGTSQPTIAPDGRSEHVTYSCFESTLLAPVPTQSPPSSRAGVEAFAQAVGLPSNRKCVSRRVFRIHLHNPPFDPIKEAVVRLRGRRVAVVRRSRRFASTIDLRGLPRGRFTIAVHLTTVLGHHLSGSRTYHTCVRHAATRSHATGASRSVHPGGR